MESKDNVRENKNDDEPLIININEDNNQIGKLNIITLINLFFIADCDSGEEERIRQRANEQSSSQAQNRANLIDENFINPIIPSTAESTSSEQKPQLSVHGRLEQQIMHKEINVVEKQEAIKAKMTSGLAQKTPKLLAPTTLRVTHHSRSKGDISSNSKTKDTNSLCTNAGNSRAKANSRSQSTTSGTPSSTRDKISQNPYLITVINGIVPPLDVSLTVPLRWKAESKVGSLKNATHRPGGGNVKIESSKLQWNVQPKVGSLEKAGHTPGGGEKRIQTTKLEWKAESKVGSLDNAKHRPGGGDVKIVDNKVDYSKIASSKVGSLEKAQHKPGGGNVKIVSEKLDFSKAASSKIGSLNNTDHKPGGGQVKIRNEKLNSDNATSKIGSRVKNANDPIVSELRVYSAAGTEVVYQSVVVLDSWTTKIGYINEHLEHVLLHFISSDTMIDCSSKIMQRSHMKGTRPKNGQL
uniref:Microtubule-associated protein n=1 Tax=Romanomermis culicivorax TaxID=13658 RepID=A0A915JTY9_ROMCU